jgi:hypothetical protein
MRFLCLHGSGTSAQVCNGPEFQVVYCTLQVVDPINCLVVKPRSDPKTALSDAIRYDARLFSHQMHRVYRATWTNSLRHFKRLFAMQLGMTMYMNSCKEQSLGLWQLVRTFAHAHARVKV